LSVQEQEPADDHHRHRRDHRGGHIYVLEVSYHAAHRPCLLRLGSWGIRGTLSRQMARPRQRRSIEVAYVMTYRSVVSRYLWLIAILCIAGNAPVDAQVAVYVLES